MKQVETTVTNENCTAVNIGSLNELNEYSFIHPKNGQCVNGKVFLKDSIQSTGTEISISTLPPNKELGYFHVHTQDEEVYIIL